MSSFLPSSSIGRPTRRVPAISQVTLPSSSIWVTSIRSPWSSPGARAMQSNVAPGPGLDVVGTRHLDPGDASWVARSPARARRSSWSAVERPRRTPPRRHATARGGRTNVGAGGPEGTAPERSIGRHGSRNRGQGRAGHGGVEGARSSVGAGARRRGLPGRDQLRARPGAPRRDRRGAGRRTSWRSRPTSPTRRAAPSRGRDRRAVRPARHPGRERRRAAEGRALEVDRRRAPGGDRREPADVDPARPRGPPPHAAAGWGRICCITSSAVKQPIPDLATSNTARAGLWGWAKTAAQELVDEGITLNLACPGLHATRAGPRARASRAGSATRPTSGAWSRSSAPRTPVHLRRRRCRWTARVRLGSCDSDREARTT